MTALEVSLALRLDVTEILEAADAPAAGSELNRLVFDQYSTDVTLDADSTPEVGGAAVDLSVDLASSSETLDLTAAPTARDINLTTDKTGQKLVAIVLVAAAENNAIGVTIGPGDTNGYNLWGNSSAIVLYPGERLVRSFTAAATAHQAVASGDRTIKFAGTAGDIVQCLAVFDG